MKSFLAGVNQPICALLDYADDRVFLEPSLFAFSQARGAGVTLDQILYGYVDDGLKPKSLRAFAGSNGVVFLPGVGYLTTDLSARQVTISRPHPLGQFSLTDGDRPVRYQFEGLARAEGTDTEILLHNEPLTDQFFRGPDGDGVNICIYEVTSNLKGVLGTALALLNDIIPELGSIITSVTRRIVLFKDERLNSFAAPAIHGTAFLNTEGGSCRAFFVEDLAHQCGHMLFTAMTLDPGEYLRVDPHRNIGPLSGYFGETRSLYVTLHGVFTECLMAVSLSRCYEQGVFRGREARELLGRLGFILLRARIDMESLCYAGVFTDTGLWLYRQIGKTLDAVHRRVAEAIGGLDFSNQAYNFSYEKFIEINNLNKI